MYTAFASVYDRLMSDVDYPAWAAFYRDLLCHLGIAQGTVCECACGTGSLTLPLAKTYDMIGVDQSCDMLSVAMDKARRAGLPIPFIQMDMQKLALHRPVDGVLCTCDGVNYLPNEQAVAAFFRAAYQALRPGGVLIFDVSTPYKLKTLLGNRLLYEDADDITYLWKNKYTEDGCRVALSLSIFQREADGRYRRVLEEQTQYGYEQGVLERLLQETGFTGIAVCGDRTPEPPRATEKRWHIAAEKKER